MPRLVVDPYAVVSPYWTIEVAGMSVVQETVAVVTAVVDATWEIAGGVPARAKLDVAYPLLPAVSVPLLTST